MDASQHTPGSAVYVGFDPTADSLHTGNLMAIMALLHFRHAGYQPIAVVRATILLLLDSLYHISSNYSTTKKNFNKFTITSLLVEGHDN